MLNGLHEVVGLSDVGIHEEIPETGTTFKENATIKAKYVFDRHRIPVFADDSGLCVQALNGEPGVYSARYAGTERDNQKNIDLLLSKLSGISDRKAYFVTEITYLDADGMTHRFSGRVNGEILIERTGSKGFGYDPVFKPRGYDISFAQMSTAEKNKISHRALAVQQLINHLSSHG